MSQVIGSVNVCSSSLEGISWLVASSTMGHCGSPRTSVVIQWLWTLLGFHLAYMWRLGGSKTFSDLGLLWLCPCYCSIVCTLHCFFSWYMVSFSGFCCELYSFLVCHFIFHWKQRGLIVKMTWLWVFSMEFGRLSLRKVFILCHFVWDFLTWFSLQ